MLCKKGVFFEIKKLRCQFSRFYICYLDSYGLSFQEDGYMNDNSDTVWAKLTKPLPELNTFSICTWIKFTYEV